MTRESMTRGKIPEIWAPISRKFPYDAHSSPMKTATNLLSTKEKDGVIKPRLFIKRTLLNRCIHLADRETVCAI